MAAVDHRFRVALRQSLFTPRLERDPDLSCADPFPGEASALQCENPLASIQISAMSLFVVIKRSLEEWICDDNGGVKDVTEATSTR